MACESRLPFLMFYVELLKKMFYWYIVTGDPRSRQISFLLLMILVIILKKSITFVYQRKIDSINQLKNKCYENLSNYWTFKFYCNQCNKNCKWSF